MATGTTDGLSPVITCLFQKQVIKLIKKLFSFRLLLSEKSLVPDSPPLDTKLFLPDQGGQLFSLWLTKIFPWIMALFFCDLY
ncbi:hypothetical protein BSG1_17204 [Bacillus sp. SG-1]|nr:hypothetical protein BSG1_17204 [Bacillus sp. SG-1]